MVQFVAISVTSLIIFFVLVHHPNYSVMASLLSDISHSVLLVLSSVAILIGFIKTRTLKFQPGTLIGSAFMLIHLCLIFATKGLRDTADAGLRDLLLRIAAFGLYAYSLFGVIAGAMQLHSTQHLFVLLTNVLTIVQVWRAAMLTQMPITSVALWYPTPRSLYRPCLFLTWCVASEVVRSNLVDS